MGLFDTGATEARHKNQEYLSLITKMFGRPWQRGLGKDPTIFGHILEGYRQGLPVMQQAADTAKQGYQSAISSLGGQGQEAYRRIQDQTQQAVSATAQGAASSGLFNSSSRMQAANQARYQGQRATGALGEGLGRAYSQTHLAGSAQYSRALEDLAAFYTQKGRDVLGAGQAMGGLISRYQFQPGQSPFQQMAPVLGAGAGWALGKWG
jgi:hypothetical protein